MNLPDAIENLRIVLYPDPVLRLRAAPVESFDAELAALVARMTELLQQAQGVGLAAPQVGVSIRLFLCNSSGDETVEPTVWVNPVLSDMEDAEDNEEGCLSLPNVNIVKRRAKSAVITGYDLKGNSAREQGNGLLARVWQHESDHLDGRLIVDDMPEVVELANRRVLKQLEADYAAAAGR